MDSENKVSADQDASVRSAAGALPPDNDQDDDQDNGQADDRDDDRLEAELREEIDRISAQIDTIIRKVDQADPVFRDTDGVDNGSDPPD